MALVVTAYPCWGWDSCGYHVVIMWHRFHPCWAKGIDLEESKAPVALLLSGVFDGLPWQR